MAGMSVDGDSQGLSRIWGALSAHMWPGMVLKSEDSTLPTSRVEGLNLSPLFL
jgi:hypothetical protein